MTVPPTTATAPAGRAAARRAIPVLLGASGDRVVDGAVAGGVVADRAVAGGVVADGAVADCFCPPQAVVVAASRAQTQTARRSLIATGEPTREGARARRSSARPGAS